MKKQLAKLLAFCVVFTFLVTLVATPVSAITWDNVSETDYASRYWTSQYKTGKFYKNMTSIPLTGDGRRDVFAVAASQMGYLEGDDTSGYTGEVGGYSNYTEYGYYLGLSGGSSHAWCAAFCAWTFYTAEVTDIDGGAGYETNSGNIWADTYVPDWSGYLIDQGRYYAAYQYRNSYSYLYDASYVPQPGDLVFFYTASGDYPGWEGHIGLVAYCNGGYVYTFEGNTSSQDGVNAEGGGAFFKKYSLTGTNLVGFGSMPYETRDDLPEIDYTGENPTPGLYVTVSGDKSVYAGIDDLTASCTLPMSSVFEVLKVQTASDGTTMLYSKCEINGSTVYGWIAHGSDSNGFTKTLQVYAAPENKIDADIKSDEYEVSEDVVKGLSAGTDVETFVSNVSTEGTVKVYNKNGAALSDTDALGTGAVVKVFDGEEVVKTYTLVVKGDVNGDAKITGVDYAMIKRHILNVNELQGVYYDAGAIMRSGTVTAYDYIMIKRYVLGHVKF